MSSTNSSSSDPRVQNNNVAQINFEDLAMRPKLTQADADNAGPDQDHNKAANPNSANLAIRPKPTQADEETLRDQSSTNISAGRPNTGQNAQVADDSLAQRNQMIDQVLARLPTLGRHNLLYIVKLFGEKPLAEVKEELSKRGIFPDDSVLLVIGNLALEYYHDIVEELGVACGPSWDLPVR
ncbi:hypothetical protein FPOAC2_11880 [Fusarium poae]|uniref:Uncharacterized protein n=1 Tax=Fusarium poae TaxID=36050 RepID=A0A1B8AEU5_FUSPO|nr:hypothetical protein FPOAC1_011571 [Fusarium poae]KAG8666754.1 hypothetical protein FPOAC1_011571 [Fusarium poae]OBS19004.1 hypothetical protein FPOA_10729 [Fusarium poae]